MSDISGDSPLAYRIFFSVAPDIVVEHSLEVGFIDTFYASRQPNLGSTFVSDTTLSGNVFKVTIDHLGQKFGLEERAGRDSTELALSPVSDIYLMDIVSRFVFDPELVKSISIGTVSFEHRNQNKYNQFPAQPVIVRWSNGRQTAFSACYENIPEGFVPVVYVRDERGKWILHFRLIAASPHRIVLKGCHRFYNRPFPDYVQRLARLTGLSERLLYVRERVSQRIPVQANGACLIPEGARVGIHCVWKDAGHE